MNIIIMQKINLKLKKPTHQLATKFNKSFDQEGNRKFNYTGPKVKENTYNPDALTYYSSFMKFNSIFFY